MASILFILKKIISALLMPLSVGLILILAALYFLSRNNTRMSKILMLVSFVWIAVMSYTPFSDLLMSPLESQYPALEEFPKDIGYVMVLGAGHTTNDELPMTSQLGRSAMFRLAEGIRVLRQLDDAKLIVSGYSGTDPTPHALMQKKMAVLLGVREERIIARYAPKDTREEAADIKPILNNQDFILVTSASHMPRAMAIFNEEGLYPYAAPTYHLAKDASDDFSIPDATGLMSSEYALHEYLGRLWLKVLKLVKPGEATTSELPQ
ncbi:MAG: ElyC/SanA/YdcF family protein [Pseudomonadota bacterium]